MDEGDGGSPRALCLGGGAICASILDPLLDDGYDVVVLDTDPLCTVADRCRRCTSIKDTWSAGPPILLVGDAISMAVRILDRGKVDLVVPGIPGHSMGRIAMAWGEGRLSPRGSLALLEELKRRLVRQGMVTMDPVSGTIIASYNPGPTPCLPDCRQEGACPVTGRVREMDMDVLLRDSLGCMAFTSSVIRPIRVGRFGAITGKDVYELKDKIDEATSGDIIGVATSCACHSILNVFKVC